MNCETCQELLSDFIDDQLDAKKTACVTTHLTLCIECAEMYEDFSSILSVYEVETVEEIPPPNEHALWCRIENIIENEIKPEIIERRQQEELNRGWFSKMWHRTWALSFTQLASAVLGIAVISSLLTVVGIRNSFSDNPLAGSEPTQQSLYQRALAKVGLGETGPEKRERIMKQRQDAIDYWNQRAASRRPQWDRNLREAFDRNLREIDQVVFDYTRNLEANPQDDLSGEMLDSALNEKVELLREFSEL